MRTWRLALGLLATAVLSVSPWPSALPVARAAEDHAAQAHQLITVTAESVRSRMAEVRWYERLADEPWRLVAGPVRARLGWAGLTPAQARRQDSGMTPMGVFTIQEGFGRFANPGTRLPYRRIDRNDAWTFDARVPSTYNLFQDVPRSWRAYGDDVEILWEHGIQYRYVAVIDFNRPPGPVTVGRNGVRRSAVPADVRKGGGIFLHVDDGHPTAGCVAIPEAAMRRVLSWLDPQAHPAIVIGTQQTVEATLHGS